MIRKLSSNTIRQGNFIQKQVEEQQDRNEGNEPFTELVRDFLAPADFYTLLKKYGMDFYCGVPDSLLKDFCAYIANNSDSKKHVITSNEGTAVSLAAGYHMATNKYGVVYLQNSGLGNIINPIMSLATPSVYSIPMLILIGWRGEPGKRDEPQHNVQGAATPGILASVGIPFQPLPDYLEGAEHVIETACHHMVTTKSPYCLLVKRQTFLPYQLKSKKKNESAVLNREEVIKLIADRIGETDIVVGTTGMLSRELYEYRDAKNEGHERDFYTVGSMGHASSIALGIAMQKPHRNVFCLDGDGAAIMHMGSLATVGQSGCKNYKHIIFNNGGHDSVGGQPSDASSDSFSFTHIAMGSGYREAWVSTTEEQIINSITRMMQLDGPVLCEIKCKMGSRKDLGRPTTTPLENKHDFMRFLKNY
ncbi:DgyrCDS14358 [Dimorphilus gyrociliatus]|uniref:2-hydroxyacyl-CoA lyase 2 n=1 Tax=Dimorphilus gyrociliatus TaxID=2664684 RepID=A0A7I8WDN9_9ANNE|nr:DgyrCDS14358 [Dimorphilus gyrociliatus]